MTARIKDAIGTDMPTAIESRLLRPDDGVEVGFAVGNEAVGVDNELACVFDEDETRNAYSEVGEEDSTDGAPGVDVSENEDKVVGEGAILGVVIVQENAVIDDTTNVADEEVAPVGEIAAVV
ncbi:MAG: hypothetical protein Q9165_001660 [Trypethelium subeluteriae]